METPQTDRTIEDGDPKSQQTALRTNGTVVEPDSKTDLGVSTKHVKHKAHKKHHGRRRKSKKKQLEDNDSTSESSDDDSSSSSSSSEDEDTPVERSGRRARKHAAQTKKKRKAHRKTRKYDSDSDSDSSDDDSSEESSEDEKPRKRSAKANRKKSKRTKKSRRADCYSDDDDNGEDHDATENDLDPDDAEAQLESMRNQLATLQMMMNSGLTRTSGTGRVGNRRASHHVRGSDRILHRTSSRKEGKKVKKASTLEYKRVDQLWDSNIHDYRLSESAEDHGDEFDEFIFTVRRQFDWENKYRNTVVDIKSKPLREALQEVMKDVKGISLVEEKPTIDPNMLFLYLEELRIFTKTTLKAKAKSERKSKIRRRIKTQRAHCKVMLGYLDDDYEDTKKTLYPMLDAGNITFDLLWALFKPGTMAFTTTYGSAEHPRCFRVEYANKESSFMRGEWYSIEGRYLEYDGKSYGLGDFEVDIDVFKGARKITSLSTYPLQYHKDPDGLKKELVERGKRFVTMAGMNYRFHHGLAFVKKKKAVAKVNINGRIMIDPAIFRRINPNYQISVIKPKDSGSIVTGLDESDEERDSDDCCCSGSDSDGGRRTKQDSLDGSEDNERTGYKVVEDPDKPNHYIAVEVPIDADGNMVRRETIDSLPSSDGDGTSKELRTHVFTDEELLIASPVVLGFAFSEKLWLEFSISGVRDIEWNEGAFDSLVLPQNQKSIVRALVESHKFHAAKTIDDVVQGKGRGLVAVLHGPPGTGKTLTAEGIAELLRCPLYMVSAGELGTDSRTLEFELQKILDIAHSWGAVLLLDEADVFLEKREVHDIHRNALVSIFLRLLEYFQGILFLTTNRVETFDDAFQSRIHVALRYGELTAKARRTVWKMFVEKVWEMEAAQAGKETGIKAAPKAITAGDAAVDKPADESSSTVVKPPAELEVVSSSPPELLQASFSEADYDMLARRALNGRQIKNSVRTAQALAVNEGTRMGMEHIKRVLDVAESFDRDLKGGTGYDDAMRSYF